MLVGYAGRVRMSSSDVYACRVRMYMLVESGCICLSSSDVYACRVRLSDPLSLTLVRVSLCDPCAAGWVRRRHVLNAYLIRSNNNACAINSCETRAAGVRYFRYVRCSAFPTLRNYSHSVSWSSTDPLRVSGTVLSMSA